MTRQNTNAFTLVELIVVITVLAVLATVAFISFQGYSQNSRDVKRTTDIKTIEKWLSLYFTNNNQYPAASSWAQVTFSGTLTSIQSRADSSVLWALRVSLDAKDPVTNQRYFYATNANLTNYTLAAELENTIWFFNNAYSQNEIFYTRWWNVWIILDNQWEIISNNLEINSVSSSDYTIVYTQGTLENVWRQKLWNNAVNNNKATAVYHPNLIGYWDMQSTTSEGNLKDLSNSQNHATASGSALEYGQSEGVSGKSTYFDGQTCLVLDNIIDFSTTNQLTFSAFVKPESTDISSSNFFNNNQFFIRRRPIKEGEGRNYEAFLQDDGAEPRVTSDISSNDVGYWDHIAASRDGTRLYIYINWKLNNSIYRSIPLTNAINSTLWCWEKVSDYSHWYTGLMDEVKIYDTALSDVEIYNLFEAK